MFFSSFFFSGYTTSFTSRNAYSKHHPGVLLHWRHWFGLPMVSGCIWSSCHSFHYSKPGVKVIITLTVFFNALDNCFLLLPSLMVRIKQWADLQIISHPLALKWNYCQWQLDYTKKFTWALPKDWVWVRINVVFN